MRLPVKRHNKETCIHGHSWTERDKYGNCRPCTHVRANRLYATNEKRREAGANQHYKKKYKITLEEYNLILAKQNGVCKICGSRPKTRRLHLDHNHKTDVIRGLLCYRCNCHLVGQNTVQTAQAVLKYLEEADRA